jgi:hypothetical protein
VARVAMAEPDEGDVRWLAERATGGDADHARWEWRYARRAFAVLVAQRDALDDRTGSVVAAAVAAAMAGDPRVARGKRAVAARQLNDRLAAYGAILRSREPGVPTGERVARLLFAFAGSAEPTEADLTRGAAAVGSMLTEAHDTLAEHFGGADLPPDVAPSSLARQP